jgi:hypothetical protein
VFSVGYVTTRAPPWPPTYVRLVHVSYHLGWCDETGCPLNSNGGKAVRPGLALLAAEASGADAHAALAGAAATASSMSPAVRTSVLPEGSGIGSAILRCATPVRHAVRNALTGESIRSPCSR